MGKISFNCTRDEAITDLLNNGFEQVFTQEFQGTYNTENEYIFARRDGLIIHFDTFTWAATETPKLNFGTLHYCWQSHTNNFDTVKYLTSSGTYSVYPENGKGKLVWLGNHDIRDGLKTITKLQNEVKILTKWVHRDGVVRLPWFVNYSERCEDNKNFVEYYNNVRATKVALLPDWVKDIIGVGQ